MNRRSAIIGELRAPRLGDVSFAELPLGHVPGQHVSCEEDMMMMFEFEDEGPLTLTLSPSSASVDGTKKSS